MRNRLSLNRLLVERGEGDGDRSKGRRRRKREGWKIGKRWKGLKWGLKVKRGGVELLNCLRVAK